MKKRLVVLFIATICAACVFFLRVSVGSRVEAASPAPSFEQVAKKTSQLPMCFSASTCVEVDIAAGGASSTFTTLTPGTWYEFEVTGDGSGKIAGCLDNTGAFMLACSATAANDASVVCDSGCLNKPKLFDNSISLKAFNYSTWCAADVGYRATGDGSISYVTDAACANVTYLWFYATTSSGMTVTMCPEIPCQ